MTGGWRLWCDYSYSIVFAIAGSAAPLEPAALHAFADYYASGMQKMTA